MSIDDLYVFITEVGYILNDVESYDRAISYLEESLKIDDSNPDVLIDLAYANEMKEISAGPSSITTGCSI